LRKVVLLNDLLLMMLFVAGAGEWGWYGGKCPSSSISLTSDSCRYI